MFPACCCGSCSNLKLCSGSLLSESEIRIICAVWLTLTSFLMKYTDSLNSDMESMIRNQTHAVLLMNQKRPRVTDTGHPRKMLHSWSSADQRVNSVWPEPLNTTFLSSVWREEAELTSVSRSWCSPALAGHVLSSAGSRLHCCLHPILRRDGEKDR